MDKKKRLVLLCLMVAVSVPVAFAGSLGGCSEPRVGGVGMCGWESEASASAEADTGTRPPGFDYRILKSLQGCRTPQWDNHWLWVSNSFLCSALPPIGLAVAGWAAPQSQAGQRDRLLGNSLEALSSLGLTAAVTMSAKYIVRRPRPFARYAGDLRCLQEVPDPSFPSGHTSFAFAAATSLSLMCPAWYVVLPAYLWAGGVAFSRLYVGAHYPTDVLAGAAVGAGCALLVHAVRSRLAATADADGTPAPVRQAVVVPLVVTF